MRILMVSNLYGALARGGAERVVEEEARALTAAGHDVAVLSGEPPRAVPKGVCLPGEPWRCPPPGSERDVRAAYDAYVKRAARPDAPREIRYWPPNVAFYADLGRHGAAFRMLWHALDVWNARSARVFSAVLGYERPDAVHTHNLMGLGFAIPAAVRRAGVRHVHTVHDVQLLDPSGLIRADRPFRPAPHQRAYAAVMRSRMGSPDVVVFPSAFHRDLHEKFGFFPRSRRVVVRNPAPPPASPRAAMGPRARFLFAGQLEAHKGVLALLDAWKTGIGSGGATLEIAGGGALEPEVRARAATLEGVRVLGRLDRAALDAAYARADFLVAPSLVIENAPASLMEAFGRGIPAVASASGGIPELVRDGETGFLAAPGDASALAAALARAAVSGPAYAAMSAACVASTAGLDPRRHAEALLALYAR